MNDNLIKLHKNVCPKENIKEIYIFGAGRYGIALFNYLINRYINVNGFIQVSSVSANNCIDVPIVSMFEFIKEKRKDTIVLLAVADRNLRTLAKTYLLVRETINKENIMDCASFIEENCLEKKTDSFCTLCGKTIDRFLETGVDVALFKEHHIIGGGKRDNALCPNCGGLDRNRWCQYVIMHFTNILYSKCMVLHFAPEKGVSDMIHTNNQCNYITADIERNKGMMVVDATNIPFQSECFDYIIANHILEHIRDESKALAELNRVLKNDGTIILSFPICVDMCTYEDDSIITDDDRLQMYGQVDHVRLYGIDYQERLEKAGFLVEVKSPLQELSLDAIERYGYLKEDIV